MLVAGFPVSLSNSTCHQAFSILDERRKVALKQHSKALGHSAANILVLLYGPDFLKDDFHEDHGLLGILLVVHDALPEGRHHGDKVLSDRPSQVVLPQCGQGHEALPSVLPHRIIYYPPGEVSPEALVHVVTVDLLQLEVYG